MSDQFGNKVDKEVWAPLRANDWIDKVEIGSVKDGSQKPKPSNPPTSNYLQPLPLQTFTEYAIAFADGKLGEVIFNSEGVARQDLMEIRDLLKCYGIDEEQWPVLMERTVETMASSWKILNV